MNRLLAHITLFLFAILFAFPMAAQDSTTEQDCDSGEAEINMEINPALCYPKSDYPTYTDAKNQMFEDVMGFVKCNQTCQLPDLFECEAVRTQWLKELDYEETETHHCFSGTLNFKWKCSPCERKKKDAEPVPVGDGASEGGNALISISNLEKSLDEGNLASIQRVFPNPTDGILALQVQVEQANSEVQVFVHDQQGRLVFQKDYSEVPRSLFRAQADLSDLSNGYYILSLRVNKTPIGQATVVVQH